MKNIANTMTITLLDIRTSLMNSGCSLPFQEFTSF